MRNFVLPRTRRECRCNFAIAATILRSQVQHSDFSSSINDFCDRNENFLKKIFKRPLLTPEVPRCKAATRRPEALFRCDHKVSIVHGRACGRLQKSESTADKKVVDCQ